MSDCSYCLPVFSEPEWPDFEQIPLETLLDLVEFVQILVTLLSQSIHKIIAASRVLFLEEFCENAQKNEMDEGLTGNG